MSELIDVLDENGVKTGRVLTRDEIHKKGLWHRAIAVAIVNEKNEVLLQQRSANKEKNANMWDISVAGHISAEQDSLSAAIREISEEVGYHVDTKDLRYMFSYRSQVKYLNDFIENQFYDFFILRRKEIDVQTIRIQESEVQAIKLVSVDALIELCKQNLIVDRKPIYDALIQYLQA